MKTFLIFTISFLSAMLSLSAKDTVPGNENDLQVNMDTTSVAGPSSAAMADSISRYYIDKYMFSKAIPYLKYAISIYDSSSFAKQIADDKYLLGDLYCINGQYHLTLSNTVEALDIYSKQNDTLNVLKCYNSLAQIYYICGELKTSSYYLDLYEKGAKELSDTLMMIKLLNNKAVISSADGDSVLTADYIRACLDLASVNGDEEVYVNIVTNLLPEALQVYPTDADIVVDLKERTCGGPGDRPYDG